MTRCYACGRFEDNLEEMHGNCPGCGYLICRECARLNGAAAKCGLCRTNERKILGDNMDVDSSGLSQDTVVREVLTEMHNRDGGQVEEQ